MWQWLLSNHQFVASMAASLSVLVALVALIVVNWQGRRFERARTIREITHWYHEKKSDIGIFKDLDYNLFTYDPESDAKPDSMKEKELTTVLDILNSTAFYVHTGAVSPDDIRRTTVGYWFDKVLSNPGVGAFLDHVANYDRDEGRAPYESFFYLRRYGYRITGRPEHMRYFDEYA